MENIVELENPIKINNETVTELTYDAREIDSMLYLEACGRCAALDKTKTMTAKLRESDYGLHMYLGFAAIVAVNPNIDFTDLERVKGRDILKISNIGLLFTLGRLGETSAQSNSDEQSENMPDISTQVSLTSKDNV